MKYRITAYTIEGRRVQVVEECPTKRHAAALAEYAATRYGGRWDRRPATVERLESTRQAFPEYAP